MKPVLVAYLAKDIPTHRGSADEYWKPCNPAARGLSVHADDLRDHARAELTAIYGVQAEADPAFASLFRPLDDRFSFLTPKEQIVVKRLRDEQADHVDCMQPLQRLETAEGASAAAAQVDQRLAKTLDESKRLEYELRESPLSQLLRTSGVDFSESEFRSVFETMHDFQSLTSPTAEAFVAQRDAINEILGRGRATQLWARMDPAFPAIEEAGNDHQLPNDTILAAYEILLDTQEQIVGMSVSRRTLREAIDNRDRRLRELVGDAAARDIVQAQQTFLVANRTSHSHVSQR